MRSVLDPLENPLLEAHQQLPSADLVMERFHGLSRASSSRLSGSWTTGQGVEDSLEDASPDEEG